MANTYDQYVKNAICKTELYIKNNYDIECYAKKSHESNIRSVIARVKFQLVKALDEHDLLPKSIIIILDDDIIRRLELKATDKYDDCNIAVLFTDIARWLANQMSRLIKTRKEQLQYKSQKQDYPIIYWVEASSTYKL